MAKGSKSEAPKLPDRPQNNIMFGDRAVASSKWNGSNFLPQWNPTESEQNTYNMAQSKLPSLFDKATNAQDFSGYANDYANNQKDTFNTDYQKSINSLKNGFVSSGQMGSSIALDKLRPLQDSYNKGIQEINANAPIMASQLRDSDQAYNTDLYNNALNNISNYYNTGNSFVNQLQGLDAYAQQSNDKRYVDQYNQWLDEEAKHAWYTPFYAKKEFWNDSKDYKTYNGGYSPSANTAPGIPLLQTAATLGGMYLGAGQNQALLNALAGKAASNVGGTGKGV